MKTILVTAPPTEYRPHNPVAEFVDEYGDKQTIHRPKGRRLSVFKGMDTPALRLNRAIAVLMGQRIKARRLSLGLSLKEVAYRAGMQSVSPKQYIHRIESPLEHRKGTVRFGTLYALAYALECAPTDLMPTPDEVMALAGVAPDDFRALAA
jgi:DNA-binding Xre family transcriptional regulator